MSKESIVKVYSTINEEDIMVIKSLLEDAGIQCYVKGDDGSIIYGLSKGLFSPMDVFVNEDDEEDVKKIIENMTVIEPLEIGEVNTEDKDWEEDCGCAAREE